MAESLALERIEQRLTFGPASEVYSPWMPDGRAVISTAPATRQPLRRAICSGKRPTAPARPKLSLPASSFSDGGPGLNAHGRWARATIRLGDKTWRRDVVAMDFDEVSRAFGTKVDGIIGQDILREFDRVTIDFPAGKIVLSKGKKEAGGEARSR